MRPAGKGHNLPEEILNKMTFKLNQVHNLWSNIKHSEGSLEGVERASP